MDWMKKHYDQFALALIALVLAGLSTMLILRTQTFSDAFSAATAPFTPREKIPPVVLDEIEKAKVALKNPPQWNESDSLEKSREIPKKRGSLFVSDYYVIGKSGALEKPKIGAVNSDSLTGKAIPNQWFMDNKFTPFETGIALQDSDKDGFANEDEWREGTDPNDKESHPAYYTKLFVKRFIRVPFRLLFNAYDGDAKKDNVKNISFQINTIDIQQPSEFLKLGEMVSRTKFKLESFKFVEKMNNQIGEMEDFSELTLVNVETSETVVLVLKRVIDSPDYYMDFYYKWPNPQIEFRVKKRGAFVLKPNVKENYKLVDSQEGKAVIETPGGKKIEILPDPRK